MAHVLLGGQRVRPRGNLFAGQSLSESEFIQAGAPGKIDFFGNLIPRETGRLRRTAADKQAGVRGQRIDEQRFIPGRRRTFEAERVPRGTAILELGLGLGASSLAPAVIGRRQFLERRIAAQKALRALDPAAPRAPEFLAGRGFSLQPLGFNLALAQFQNPALFNFENRRVGGFLIGGTEEETNRFRRKRTRQRIPLPPANIPAGAEPFSGEAAVGETLLTSRIRRQKLTKRGTVRPLEAVKITQTRSASGTFT